MSETLKHVTDDSFHSDVLESGKPWCSTSGRRGAGPAG